MIPGLSAVKGRLSTDGLDESALKDAEAIIHSMTPQERKRPEIIGGSRRRRIARGSGTSPQAINQLLNQFRQMQKLLKQLSSGKQRGKLMRSMQKGGNPFGL
jgi:signal recognition particle subunit SRP54